MSDINESDKALYFFNTGLQACEITKNFGIYIILICFFSLFLILIFIKT